MKEVYIVDAVRTPVGRMGGTLKTAQAHELGAVVCKALMERTGLDPKLVEEVVIAQVKQNAKASNIARVISLLAGFPEEIPLYPDDAVWVLHAVGPLRGQRHPLRRCGCGGGRRRGGHERHPL